jgi:hypothetical protein
VAHPLITLVVEVALVTQERKELAVMVAVVLVFTTQQPTMELKIEAVVAVVDGVHQAARVALVSALFAIQAHCQMLQA